MATETTIRPHTVAFMDFGTNSVRLLVVRIEPNQACTVLHLSLIHISEPTRH